MNNQLQKSEPRSLVPKIEDLYSDIELAGKHNELSKLLNCQPKKEWIKQNPFANNSDYIPIEIIEYLLTSIFIKWKVEIKSVQVIANSVAVTVRLYTLDPITGEWDWQEGVGASPIQTKKGAAATDFGQVNTSAVQMAAPAAESYAIKDAAEKLGKLFGKDLNRKDEMNYLSMLNGRFGDRQKSDLPQELKDVIEVADWANLSGIYNSNPEYHSNPEFMKLLTDRKAKLNASRDPKKTTAN